MPAYPKPDGQKVTRHAPQFTWVDLPASGRRGKAPKLPDHRQWSPKTVAFWADLWKSPQAVMWDPSGRTLWRLAELHADLIDPDGGTTAGISAEMRQLEDRHGLSPKSMLQLRWRVSDDASDGEEPAPKPTVRRLKVAI